jgi:hypothetical protein
MEAWLKASLENNYVAKVDGTVVQRGVHCDTFLSPWYDDGIVFDWTTLHQRLVQPTSAQPYVEQFVAALARFGSDALSTATGSGKECFSTVVELKAPWSLHPLSDQAQELSIFDAPVAGPSSPPKDARVFYKFLRGPPGQRAVRDDMSRVLASVQAQLRQNGIQVFCFLASIVVVHDDFTVLLHRTAAVFRALTDVGFTIDGHGSSLGPRVMQPIRVNGEDWWTTLPLQKLTAADDVASFVVGLFFQWLQDAYVWGCSPPLRLFLEAMEKKGEGRERGVQLFERFVRGLVLPHVHAIGLDALPGALPEEGGSLMDLAAVKLEKKLPPVGPQRWSTLELRLVLCQINAYHHLPAAYLGQHSAAAVLSK